MPVIKLRRAGTQTGHAEYIARKPLQRWRHHGAMAIRTRQQTGPVIRAN